MCDNTRILHQSPLIMKEATSQQGFTLKTTVNLECVSVCVHTSHTYFCYSKVLLVCRQKT